MGNWYVDPLRKNGITVRKILESGTFFLTLDCLDEKKEAMIVKAYESDVAIENNKLANSFQIYNDIINSNSNLEFSGISIYKRVIIKQNLAFLCRRKHQFTLAQRMEEYPPLESIEKLWITYRLVNLVQSLHECNLVHGAINPDNVFVNWDLEVNIGDMAPFKPSQIKSTRPDLFHHFFATMSRSSCYLAPEQLLLPEKTTTDNVFFGIGTFPMDYFAVGLVIYYLYTGEHLFTFSQLIQFSTGIYQIDDKINNLPIEIRGIVQKLLKLDPNQRVMKDENFPSYFPKTFPQIEAQFSEFFSSKMELEHLIKLIPIFQMIIENSSSDVRLIFINVFTSFLNASKMVQEKVVFSSFICDYILPLSDSVKLGRVLPIFSALLSIQSNILKSNALSCIVKLVKSLDEIPTEFTSIFDAYLIPMIIKSSNGASTQYRCALAYICPHLAVEIERLQPESAAHAMEMVNFIITEKKDIVIGAFVTAMRELSQSKSTINSKNDIEDVLEKMKDLTQPKSSDSLNIMDKESETSIPSFELTDEENLPINSSSSLMLRSASNSTLTDILNDQTSPSSKIVNHREDPLILPEMIPNEQKEPKSDDEENTEQVLQNSNEEFDNKAEENKDNEFHSQLNPVLTENVSQDNNQEIKVETSNIDQNNNEDKGQIEVPKEVDSNTDQDKMENSNEKEGQVEKQNNEVVHEEKDLIEEQNKEFENEKKNLNEEENNEEYHKTLNPYEDLPSLLRISPDQNMTVFEGEKNVDFDNILNENYISQPNKKEEARRRRAELIQQKIAHQASEILSIIPSSQSSKNFANETNHCNFNTFEHFTTVLLSCLNSNCTQFKVSILNIFKTFFENSLVNERYYFRKLYKSITPLLLGLFGDENSESIIEGYLEFILWFTKHNLVSKHHVPELILRISKYRRSESPTFRYYSEKIVSYLPKEFDTENDTTFVYNILFQRIKGRGIVSTNSKSKRHRRLRRLHIKNAPLLIKGGISISPKFLTSKRVSRSPITYIAPHFLDKIRAVASDASGALYRISSSNHIQMLPNKLNPIIAMTEMRNTPYTFLVDNTNKIGFIDWKNNRIFGSKTFLDAKPVKLLTKQGSLVYSLLDNGTLSLFDCRTMKPVKSITFDKNLTPSALASWHHCVSLGVGFQEGMVDIIDPRMMLIVKSVITEPVLTLAPCQRNCCNFVVGSPNKIDVYDALLGKSELSILLDSSHVISYDGNVVVTGPNDVYYVDCENFENSCILSDLHKTQNLGIGVLKKVEVKRDLSGLGSLHKHSSAITYVNHSRELFISGDVDGFLNFWQLS